MLWIKPESQGSTTLQPSYRVSHTDQLGCVHLFYSEIYSKHTKNYKKVETHSSLVTQLFVLRPKNTCAYSDKEPKFQCKWQKYKIKERKQEENLIWIIKLELHMD